MDISAIGGALTGAAQARMSRESASVESFEALLNRAEVEKEKEDIKKACVEFESYFLNLMFKEMRKTRFSEEGILPKSFAEETFEEMLDQERSKNVANAGGIGLANMMYEQMTRNLK